MVGTWFSEMTNNQPRSGGSLTGPGPSSQPQTSWATGSQTGSNWGTPSPPPLSTQSSPMPVRQQVEKNAIGNTTFSNALAQQAVGGSGMYSSGYAGYNSPLMGPSALATAFYGPQSELLNQQRARQYDQLGLIQPDVDYRKGALQRDTDLARRGLDIDKARVGIDTGLTKTQQANLDRLRGILGKRYGLEGEDLANKLAQLGIDEAKLRDMAKRQTFDLRSNLTARGAFNTIANERGTGRINRDLMYGLGGINNQRTAYDIAHRSNVLGLDEQGIGYDNQGAALAARLANNGLDLQKIGLDAEKLTNNLNDGLRQIGLEGMVSINGLLDAIGGTNAQQAQLATNILTQVLGFADLPPDALAQLAAALGISLTPKPQTDAGSAPRAGQAPL
jgi:hypothetical protein